jgi:putative ABC transport system substrate-binding protein
MTLRRREFITLLGGTAAWPIAARAQQPARLPVIGFLSTSSPGVYAARLQAFQQGLGENGYVDGRNVAIQYRWAVGQYDRMPALAAELVGLRPAVLIASNAIDALALKAATTTIPIVFSMAVDPVALGLVASLNRPGGQMTGVANLSSLLGPKRLELLHEAIPGAAVIALLVNPANFASAEFTRDTEAAARSLGLQLHVLNASAERDFEPAFASLHELRAGGLVIGFDSFFTTRSEQLAALAARHAVPAIFSRRDFAAAGGLMSYSSSDLDILRSVGIYTARILKGEKPADLPVYQATRVELVINLKTAKALGLSMPITLLGRADEIIE